MDASLASYQARLATFQGVPAKSRRSSSRSKKAAPRVKAAWPLSSPSAQDLAYAGFVWRPTSASPDNVQCFACNCQLDGWEEADVPAYEHLTHSPTCGFAVVTNIRLRHGDPARTEEDPTSEAMVACRRETFGDIWPLDIAAGFPGAEQLAAAGWYYDPADDTPDGVTCPYCHLSLDAWDSGDDPLEEHRRRASDCLFFALTELYHPTQPEPKPKKAKRATKTKRASARSSVASNASTAAAKKSIRTKKRTSEVLEDEPQFSESVQDSPKRMRFSSISSLPSDLPVGTPRKMPAEMDVEEPFTMSSLPASLLVGTPKRTPSHLREEEEGPLGTNWQSTDVDMFFANQPDVGAFLNDVMIDAGLDQLTTTGQTAENIQAALLAALTDEEKSMTIERWVLYNAQRGEEKLRRACEQQIAAYQREGQRALAALEAIPTY
jgi:hypothetical protein